MSQRAFEAVFVSNSITNNTANKQPKTFGRTFGLTSGATVIKPVLSHGAVAGNYIVQAFPSLAPWRLRCSAAFKQLCSSPFARSTKQNDKKSFSA